MFDMGERLEQCEGDLLPGKKKFEHRNKLLIDVQNYPSFRGFLGCVRVIVLKWVKLETQLAILGPRRGHALRNNKE
jgi:hypothetical protein